MLRTLGIGIISSAASAAQTEQTPPAELVQYIRETKSHGFADAKIKSQRAAVGWPAAIVDEVLAYHLRNEKSSQPTAPVAKAAAPTAASPDPTQLPAVSPGLTTPKRMPALQTFLEPRGRRMIT
jgi:hypothetical protein